MQEKPCFPSHFVVLFTEQYENVVLSETMLKIYFSGRKTSELLLLTKIGELQLISFQNQ